MATKEAALSSDIDSYSATLSSIRSRIEDDQRRQRMIEEQVEATRDRHRRAQGELSELESKINQAQMNLKQIQTEARAASERQMVTGARSLARARDEHASTQPSEDACSQ